VIPAVLAYHLRFHGGVGPSDVRHFLLTAAAIGEIIKHGQRGDGASLALKGDGTHFVSFDACIEPCSPTSTCTSATRDQPQRPRRQRRRLLCALGTGRVPGRLWVLRRCNRWWRS
jgi:hypothetical protein